MNYVDPSGNTDCPVDLSTTGATPEQIAAHDKYIGVETHNYMSSSWQRSYAYQHRPDNNISNGTSGGGNTSKKQNSPNIAIGGGKVGGTDTGPTKNGADADAEGTPDPSIPPYMDPNKAYHYEYEENKNPVVGNPGQSGSDGRGSSSFLQQIAEGNIKATNFDWGTDHAKAGANAINRGDIGLGLLFGFAGYCEAAYDTVLAWAAGEAVIGYVVARAPQLINQAKDAGSGVKTNLLGKQNPAKGIGWTLEELEQLDALSGIDKGLFKMNKIFQALKDQGFTNKEIFKMMDKVGGGGIGYKPW
jgi:hypothetical protein